MCTDNKKNGRLAAVLLIAVLFACVALPVGAQDAALPDLTIADDTLSVEADQAPAVDSAAFAYQPEWYVAPVIPAAKRAPKRATMAVNCPTDSVLTFNVDSVLVEVASYDYDDAGNVIRSIKWACEPDGKRVGTFKEEYGFDANGTQVMTAVYAWDNTINDWRGTEKSEFVYDNEDRIVSNTEYTWLNNAWVPQTKYTYTYDSEGREAEFYTYSRNKNTNQLEYSKAHLQQWDDAGRKIMDVQYTAYSNGGWSAGTKTEWTYDANGNQTEYVYYASIANHNWVGSMRELWEYNAAGKKTMYTKYSWANSAWVGESKEEWQYAGSTLTLNAKYVWSNGAWVGSAKEVWEYTSNNLTLHEKFAWAANDWAGTEREQWTYTSGKKTLYQKDVWSNGAWVGVAKEVWAYNTSGKQTNYKKYIGENGVWTGVSKESWAYTSNNMTQHNTFTWLNGDWANLEQEQWEYTSGKQTLYIKSSWTDNAWLGVSKEVAAYTSGKQTLRETYTGENGTWIAVSKEVWAYTSGKQTLHETYTGVNNAWVGVSKEAWAFNTAGLQTLHEDYTWTNDAWVISTRVVADYDAAGNQILDEQYATKSGVFTGTKKEEYTFNAAGKMINKIVYKWNKTSAAFVESTWNVTDYDEAGNLIESCKYVWKSGAWAGSGSRTLTTFNSDKKQIDMITQSWKSGAWTNVSRQTTTYVNGLMMQEASFTWTNDEWVGGIQKDYYYNAAGQNDSIISVKNSTTGWINYRRTVNRYDARGYKVLTENATWKDGVWVMTSMEKLDVIFDSNNRQLLYATWNCDADGIWKGLKKDTAAYSVAGKKIYEAHYVSWLNNDWVPKYKESWEYDSAGNEILHERYDWENKAWYGHFKYENEYDEHGRQIMTANYLNWNASAGVWIGGTKYGYAYDDAGRKTSQISYTWKNGGWDYSFSYTYQYDAAGHVVLQLVQRYTSGAWVNSDKYEKEYRGSTLIKDNAYSWSSNQWQVYKRYELYYDNDSQAKLRRDVSGAWVNGVVQTFANNLYFYNCDIHYFTINFKNYDGTLLASNDVEQGKLPVYTGDTPVKPADAQYTYTFAGWDKAIVPADGHTTYVATFSSTKNKYTITWLNEDGSQIDQTMVEYGVIPTHTEPTKANTAEYTYTFAGWDKTPVAVTGEATYTATFSSAKNKYLITFQNEDGSVIEAKEYEYGTTPVAPADPTKDATAQYTYTFNGWDNTIVAVTGAATYKATFTSTLNKYLITFQNEDGSVIAAKEYEYGATPVAPADPTKEATAQYTYTFNGWDNTIVAVTGAATYKATFTSTLNKYLITFQNEDGSVIEAKEYEYGATPVAPADPTKEATAQYTYTFSGWDNTIVAVTGAATYKATFTTTLNKYLITFQNEDGSTIEAKEYEYGATPVAPADPTKEATAQYTYTFNGWDNTIVAVTGAATYKATFTSTLNKYLITFQNEDGSTIEAKEYEYGATPVAPADPTKEATAQYTYTFSGWDNTIVAVTGVATYKATFTSTLNKYLITFQNEDGSVIEAKEYEYGATPVAPAAPTKDATAQYTYTFNGWDNTIVAVTGEATYKATFTSTLNKYLITFQNEDGSVIEAKEYEYGATPVAPADPTKDATAQYTYTFNGWDNTIVAVTGTATYKATFTSTLNKYLITFQNEDGSVIEAKEYEYGATPVAPADPTKQATAQYTYTFNGWDNTIVAVTGEATYKATFEATVNSYIITWVDEDGVTVLYEGEFEYGSMPEYGGADPTKEATAEYTYSFAGWTPEVVEVVGTATYTATYTATLFTGVDNAANNQAAVKVVENGIVYIVRAGKKYAITGAAVE